MTKPGKHLMGAGNLTNNELREQIMGAMSDGEEHMAWEVADTLRVNDVSITTIRVAKMMSDLPGLSRRMTDPRVGFIYKKVFGYE
jgi:hypothetical protein